MEHTSLLRLIRDQWAVVVVCAVLGVLAGHAFATSAVREYTASAYVFVTVTGGTSTGEVTQSGNFAQQQARNFSAVATREVVLAQVIKSLELDVSINQLRRQVSTSVPLNTAVITISATDTSPARAAAIANSVATHLAAVVPALSPRVDGESPVRMQTIESARPPVYPSSPNVPLLLFLGLLCGLVLASVLVVIRGLVDSRVRTKAQVTEITGSTVVGTIAYDRRATRSPMAFAHDTHSLRAEEFRQLRASLHFLQPGVPHKVFVFTSSIPGEGKSSTAANTAAALAASGLRVCLVEADLRQPSLAGALDLPGGIGLTYVLTGDATLEESMLEWGTDGLQVLLAGDRPPNPSELLESTATVAVLEAIRERFDVTIIDCPPLNPVSDAAVLAHIFGRVLLVVGARRVRVRELRRALDRLATVGASVEGVVLTLTAASEAGRYRHEYVNASPIPDDDTAPLAGSIRSTSAPVESPGSGATRVDEPPRAPTRSPQPHEDPSANGAPDPREGERTSTWSRLYSPPLPRRPATQEEAELARKTEADPDAST